MRITGLDVGGFGLLCDLTVHGIGPGTTVVYGPNEAGKSTLHTFVVRTLFGHPRINDARDRRRHEPLRGGRHGGVVRVIDDGGEPWEIHRYTIGTPVLRVVMPDGAESTRGEVLAGLLGRDTDEDRYEQVYAIDLDALAGLGALAGDTLDHLLLDAATVGAGRSMRRSIEALEKRREAVWTPRSRTLPLNREIAARRTAERRLREAREAAGMYREVHDELEHLERQLEEARSEQVSVRERIRRLERLQGAWDTWGDRLDAQQRIADAAGPVVPEGLVDEVAALQAARQAAVERAEALHLSARTCAEEAASIDLDEGLAAIAVRVGDHAADLGLQTDRRRRLGVAAVHARTSADAAAEAVAALPEQWDAERVMGVSSDPTNLPTVQRTAGELRDSGQELQAARRAVDDAQDEQQDADALLVRAQSIRGDEPSAEVRARRAAVGALRGALPDLERMEAGGDEPVTGPRWPARAALAAAVVLVVIAVTALVTGAVSLGVAVLAAGVLVGLAAFGTVRATRPTRGPAHPGGTVTADLRGQIIDAADTLGLSPPITRAEVELADQVTADLEDARRTWQERRIAADAAAERAAAAATSLGRAEEHRDACARTADDAQAAWTSARDRAGLGVDVEPSSAAVLLGAVAEARRALLEAVKAADGHAGLDAEVAAYDAITVARCADVGREAGDAPDAALRRLHDDCQANSAASSRRATLTASAEQDREAADAESQRAASVDDALSTAYARVGVDSDEAFPATVARDAKRREAERDRDQADRDLRRRLGSDAQAARLRSELETGQVGAWADELAELTARDADLEEARDELVSDQTRTRQRLQELGEDDAVAVAALEVETRMARCAELTEQWITTDLAAQLLHTTLERFEDAHQPSVLHAAGTLLDKVTLGRWTDVRRIDDQLYVAADADPVPASALSRGATEQLYLCLRLALAEELNRNGTCLPLLIDDLMANADPQRADGLARVLADVATRQQVVVFTCNPATVERVVAADASAGVLSMQERGTGAVWTRTSAT